MRRSKVIIMVSIWKCVGLTPIWSNFADVHHFYTDIFQLFTIVLLIQRSPYLSDTVFNLYLIKWS